MENNKRCAIFSPSLFLGIKKNGCRSRCRVSQYSRFDYRIFAIFRVFVWASFWLWPCFFRSALAEFDSADSSNLAILKEVAESIKINTDSARIDLDTIQQNTTAANAYLRNIEQYTQSSAQGLGYYGTSATGTLKGDMTKILNYMGYGSGTSLASQLTSLVNQTNQIKTNLGGDNYNTIADRLDDLIDYLENSSSTPTDYATETTLSAFKSKYEEVANQFLTSWGFVGGSDGSYKDFLSHLFTDKVPLKVYRYFTGPLGSVRDNANGPPWQYSTRITLGQYTIEDVNFRDFWTTYLPNLMVEQTRANYLNFAQLGWQNWQAHTNTVAHLDMIVSSLNSTPDIYVNDTDDIGTVTDDKLNITFDKSTGDSPESIELNPAFTNDVAQLTDPAQSLTNKVAKLITYSKLSNRYKTPNVDETNYRDYEIIQDIPDYNLQYGTRPQMVFTFTSTARNLFRGFLPREKMTTLRNIFLKLWAFLAIYCNFLIFKIFGKMGGSE